MLVFVLLCSQPWEPKTGGEYCTRTGRRGDRNVSEKPFVLTIDQGTTSSRAILFERNSTARAVAQLPITQHYPSGGWVDHDASEIWHSVRSCVGQVLSRAGITLDNVSAIGITNQRETTVVWDRTTAEPLAPAIVWQSRQSVPYVDAVVRRGMGPRYTSSPGWYPMRIFPRPNWR